MAPNRGTKKPADTDDSDDDKKPNYDCNDRNLQLFLQELKRWLPRQHSQLKNFLRYGFIINSRQEVLVFDDDHKQALQNGTLAAGTFEKPCTIGLEDDGETSDVYDSDGDVAAALPAELSARKIRPTPASSTSATPGLRGTPDDQYKIAPRSLASFDADVLETILHTFDDEETADEAREDSEERARPLARTPMRT